MKESENDIFRFPCSEKSILDLFRASFKRSWRLPLVSEWFMPTGLPPWPVVSAIRAKYNPLMRGHHCILFF